MLLVVPISRRIDAVLLPILVALRFRWGQTTVRERFSLALIRGGDVRGALALRRQGAERAVDRGGIELAMEATSYGILLLAAGWVAEGIDYLKVAAQMTAGWPSNRLRDLILYTLATGHAFRGEEPEIVSAVAAPARASGAWRARLLSVRAAGQMAAGEATEAAASYAAALDAAHESANRELVRVMNSNLADALIEARDLPAAEARIVAAETVTSQNDTFRAHLFGLRAELALARGDTATALWELDRSEALKNRAGLTGGIGWTLATRARIVAAAGNRGEAKRLLVESADRLQDLGALRAWRQAASVIGESDAGVRLALAAPDPLLDRVRANARQVRVRGWVVHRGIAFGIVLAAGFPLIWLSGRYQERLPGGGTTLTVLTVLLMVLLLGSFFFTRVPRR